MCRLRGMLNRQGQVCRAGLSLHVSAMMHVLRRSGLNTTETTQCELNLVCPSVLLKANVEELTATKFQIGQYLPRPVSITWKLETPWCLWSWSSCSTEKRTVSHPRRITQVQGSRGLCLFRDPVWFDNGLLLRSPAQGAMLALLTLKYVRSSLWWNRQVIDLLQINQHWDNRPQRTGFRRPRCRCYCRRGRRRR